MTKFIRLGPNAAQSMDGFIIEKVSQSELLYRENSRSLTVAVESGGGMSVYKESILIWNPPNNQNLLSVEDRIRILKNVCDALDFLKISYIVE